MSFDAYNRALPDHYLTSPGAPPAADLLNPSDLPAANGQESSKKATTKGFIDLIEAHVEGFGGRDITVLQTSKYLPRKSAATKKPETEYKDYAVILRRTVLERNKQANVVRLELEIHSKRLCQKFREIAARSYESTDLQTYPIKIRGPFSELFFYRKEIHELAENQDIDADLRRDAKALDDFVNKGNGMMTSIIEDHERYSKDKKVINDILWTIYPPNSLAVLDLGKIKECWLVRNVYHMEHPKSRRLYWVVTGLRLDYDGTAPGLTRQKFLTPLTGMRPHKLLARSKKLRAVLGGDFSSFGCQIYSGPSWDNGVWEDVFPVLDGANPILLSKHIQERVMVDFKSFAKDITLPSLVDIQKDAGIHPSKGRTTARGTLSVPEARKRRGHRQRTMFHSDDSDSDFNEPKVDEMLQDLEDPMRYRTASALEGDTRASDEIEHGIDTLQGVAQATIKALHISHQEFELIFPAFVPAFGLRTKKWKWILSDELQDVRWNNVAFQSLQLEEVTKKLVESLVKGHKNKSVAFDDVIAGKGQGLVFLLHGNPGLGKTLTAGGELSTRVSDVEERLDDIFDLAKRWDAVTLLDEADVLLCKRNSADMERNAIVGVFLRTLEYFQGVLFLTTNRKDDFDDAFKSRIHVTICYPELSEKAQSQIWEGLITANQKVATDRSWNEEVYGALGRLNLNVSQSKSAQHSMETPPKDLPKVDLILNAFLNCEADKNAQRAGQSRTS
ncbi:hypothetical protein B0T09DRAFT_265866 [Sordaria sp. MPI-SDFR-AT-0083]|nr:hypothetical protein B0T09DRAFT_265866 [Sordaria sp. MPI-SDFR-AT-0083]